MRRILPMLLVILTGCGTAMYYSADPSYGKAIEFAATADGRLLLRLSDGRLIELNGVQIPDRSSRYHLLSLNFFQRLTRGRRLRLEYDIRKRITDRLLVYVYVGDVFVNKEMIRRGYGYALPTPPNDTHDGELRQVEDTAKAEKRLIWKDRDDLKETLF